MQGGPDGGQQPPAPQGPPSGGGSVSGVSQGTQYLLTAKVFSAKSLTKILTVLQLSGKRETKCHINATPAGMQIVVDKEDKALQASAVLQADVFNEYQCPNEVQFQVSLNNILDCMGMYGSNNTSTAAVMLRFPGAENSLQVLLQEGDKSTICQLCTYESESWMDMEFACYPVASVIPMKTDLLRELVSDVENFSERAAMTVTPSLFRLTSEGSAGSVNISVSYQSDWILQGFTCNKEIKTTLTTSHLVYATKLLEKGSVDRSTLRINSEGMVCVQHFIRTADQGPPCMAEFILLPLVEMDLD